MSGFMHMRSDDTGKLLIRIAVGVIMLFHGISKLSHGVEWIKYPLSQVGLPGILAYGAYVGEIVAPVLLLIGYKTRLAALLVAFDIFMAIVLVMKHQVFSIKEMGGGWGIELEFFILLASLALFFTGSGKYKLTKAQSTWD